MRNNNKEYLVSNFTALIFSITIITIASIISLTIYLSQINKIEYKKTEAIINRSGKVTETNPLKPVPLPSFINIYDPTSGTVPTIKIAKERTKYD